MLSITFENVPLPHLIFMPIIWISMFIYLRIIYIMKCNKTEFQSPFFVIIKLNAITDFLMFLNVELLTRPRKYSIYNLMTPLYNNWIPQLQYFAQTWIKNTMFLGYVVIALNRLTTMFSPFVNGRKIWSTTVIKSIYLLEWIVPSTILIPLFFTGRHNFSFVPIPTGLALRAEPEFMKMDALQDFIISSACFVLSSVFYILVFIIVWKNDKVKNVRSSFSVATSAGSRIFMNSSMSSTDSIIFKCAIFSFIFFIPNTIKTIILYFATDATLVNVATELWFFTTELMCISTPWSLIIGSQKVRNDFLPKRIKNLMFSFSSRHVSSI